MAGQALSESASRGEDGFQKHRARVSVASHAQTEGKAADPHKTDSGPTPADSQEKRAFKAGISV